MLRQTYDYAMNNIPLRYTFGGAMTGSFMMASLVPAFSQESKGFFETLFGGNKNPAPLADSVTRTGPMPAARKPEIRKKAAAYFAQNGCNLGAPVYFRAAKSEQRVEMWAQCGGAAYKKIAAWPFTANRNSQLLGYKNYQGDARIPEGMRRVNNVNDVSSYYLSFNMGYPDAADMARPRPKGKGVGGDTMMHGPYGSIGCIPIAFENIEIAYAATEAAIRRGNPVHFDIFPSFDLSEGNLRRMAALSPGNEKYLSFWRNLAAMDQPFQQTHMRGNIVASGTQYALGGAPRVAEPEMAFAPVEKPVPVPRKMAVSAPVPVPVPVVRESFTAARAEVPVAPQPAPVKVEAPVSVPVATPAPKPMRLGPPDPKTEIIIPVEIVIEVTPKTTMKVAPQGGEGTTIVERTCRDGKIMAADGMCVSRPPVFTYTYGLGLR